MLRFVIDEADADHRVDVVLAAVAGITRSQARRWIDGDRVRLNAAACRSSQSVRAGDILETSPPEATPSSLGPEAIPLCVVYEDSDIIVIDKPAGMVVHPAPGHATGTLVNALLHHCGDLAGIGGVMRPGIVHRLDRGTSGVMVAAKNDVAHEALSEQFRDHSIERVYRALVRGAPSAAAGRIDRPIGRHRRDRKRMSVNTHRAREAHTAWCVVERFVPRGSEPHAWLEIRPETGRTHQIRVHLASVGLPIAGDPVYGGGRARRERLRALAKLNRPALHAAVLGFTHPRRGESLRFEVPLPQDLAHVLEALALASTRPSDPSGHPRPA